MMSIPSTIGPYTVNRELGRGGMGVVYHCTDPETGDVVAIKIILSDLIARKERDWALIRLEREAEIGRSMDHPNIIKLYNYCITDSISYLVMEYFDGTEIKKLLDDGFLFTPDLACEIVLKVLGALDYIHRKGVVHRDIKTSNIMVDEDWSVKLMDFGIAHISGSELTKDGEIFGTPSFMAPELFHGEIPDHRADMYAVGVLLFYLLTRRKPFEGPMATIISQALFNSPAPPSTIVKAVPPEFDQVALTAMAKNPAQRYQRATDFSTALCQQLEKYRVRFGSDQAASAVDQESAECDGAAAPPSIKSVYGRLTALLQCLDGPPDQISAETLARDVASLLREWQQCIAGPMAETLNTGRQIPLTAQSESMIRLARRILIERLEPFVLEQFPQPGSATDDEARRWKAVVAAMLEIRRSTDQVAQSIGGSSGLPAPTTPVAQMALTSGFRFCSSVHETLLSNEEPDLAQIENGLTTLDVIQDALMQMNQTITAQALFDQKLLLCLTCMRRVREIFRAWIDSEDEIARFGVAHILINCEALVALARRLVESDPMIDVDGAADQVRQTLAMGAFVDFVECAGGVGKAIIDEQIMLLGSPDAGRFDLSDCSKKLRQVGYVYLFASRLTQTRFEAGLKAFTANMYLQMERLAETVLSLNSDETLLRLSVFHDLAEEFGWRQLAQRLVNEMRRLILDEDTLLPTRLRTETDG